MMLMMHVLANAATASVMLCVVAPRLFLINRGPTATRPMMIDSLFHTLRTLQLICQWLERRPNPLDSPIKQRYNYTFYGSNRDGGDRRSGHTHTHTWRHLVAHLERQ